MSTLSNNNRNPGEIEDQKSKLFVSCEFSCFRSGSDIFLLHIFAVLHPTCVMTLCIVFLHILHNIATWNGLAYPGQGSIS